jgi:hypothetical protein
MMRPVLGSLILASVLCSPAAAQNPAPFRDVTPPHYAFDAVSELAAKGVLKGYPDGSYQGRRALTRYEFAAGLDRYLSFATAAVIQSAEETNRTAERRRGPRGLPGEPGARGPRGAAGAAGPLGPRGLVTAEWAALVREQQRQREDLSGIRILFVRMREDLPRLEIEEVWSSLEGLDQRLRRAAKPVPGILRGRRRR